MRDPFSCKTFPIQTAGAFSRIPDAVLPAFFCLEGQHPFGSIPFCGSCIPSDRPDPASGPDPIPYGGSPVPFCCFSVSGKAVQFHLRPAGASLAVLADLLYISYSCQTEPSQPPGEPVFLLSLVCGPVCFRLWIFPGHPFCRSLFPEGLWKPCAGACRRHRAVSAFGSRSCLAFCAIVWGMPWKG